MEKELVPNLLRSPRRTLALQIAADGSLVIRAPHNMPESIIQQFVHKKRDWIHQKQQLARQRFNSAIKPSYPSTEELAQNKQKALAIISARAQYFAVQMRVQYSRLTISNASKRWGSCNTKGRINFSWRLVVVPLPIIDYVVVHELAHLAHLNHSQNFWQKVGRTLPDYKQRRAWLKENGHVLLL